MWVFKKDDQSRKNPILKNNVHHLPNEKSYEKVLHNHFKSRGSQNWETARFREQSQERPNNSTGMWWTTERREKVNWHKKTSVGQNESESVLANKEAAKQTGKGVERKRFVWSVYDVESQSWTRRRKRVITAQLIKAKGHWKRNLETIKKKKTTKKPTVFWNTENRVQRF